VDEAPPRGSVERSDRDSDLENRAHPEVLPESLRFGGFELRLNSRELLCEGELVSLQQQPARVLALLAGRAGAVVSRDEIRETIWGEDTFVDSEQGINYCIRQIRIALDDHPERPRFLETVPKRGYRFVAPVEEVGLRSTPPEPARGRSGRLVRLALVTLAVAAAATLPILLGVRNLSDAGRPATIRTTVIPEEAHFRYLEARHLLDRADSTLPVAEAERAIELLHAALEEAPEFAPAHAALGDAWLYRYDLPRAEALAHAEESARRALELDPGLARAHALLSAPLLFLRLDWEAAEEHVERALELDPENVEALFMKAVLRSARGRHDEGIAAARRALELDPGHLPDVSLGWFYFFARRYDQAIEEAERIVALEPTDEPSHRVLFLAALEKGDQERARQELERYWKALVRRNAGAAGQTPPSDDWLDAQIGEIPSVPEIYRVWKESVDDERHLVEQAMNPTIPAEYAAYAEAPEQAIHYLLWACEERVGSWDLPFVAEDPRWDPLRDEPGFREVLRCVGVEDREGIIPRFRELFD
jgi:DNA-binding winged helix-turn-helix (wHTH) protein/Tfp pilus assembly protein PilF